MWRKGCICHNHTRSSESNDLGSDPRLIWWLLSFHHCWNPNSECSPSFPGWTPHTNYSVALQEHSAFTPMCLCTCSSLSSHCWNVLQNSAFKNTHLRPPTRPFKAHSASPRSPVCSGIQGMTSTYTVQFIYNHLFTSASSTTLYAP